jgi:hypothetical protein
VLNWPPPSNSRPAPAFISPPDPVTLPLIVRSTPDGRLIVPRPALSTTFRLVVKPLVAARVPPPNVSAVTSVFGLPRFVSLATCSVPPLVVAPLKVLPALVRTSVPLPSLTSVAVTILVGSVTAPEIVA